MKTLWLVSLLISQCCGDIIGVAPENQHLYYPIDKNGEKKWKCLNSDIEINYSQINDDICDCPDGSDEPGTHACPNHGLKFYCANEGHISGYIERFKVDDGVCDYDLCCDGSDEYISGGCPNKCKEVHEQYLNYKQKVLEDISNAANIQKSLISKASSQKQAIKTQLDNYILEKQKLLDKLPPLERQLKAALKTNNHADLVFDKISSFTLTISEKLSKLINVNRETTAKLDALENILSDLINNYNPNFNDAAVKQAVSNFQNYISNKQINEINANDIVDELNKLNEHSKTIKISSNPSHTIPNVSNMIHYYIDSLFKFINNEGDADDSDVNIPISKSVESVELELKTIKSKLTKVESAIIASKADLEVNYGPSDILRAVAGNWINAKNGEYEYKVGLLDSVYQDNNHLGSYKGYDESTGLLIYTNGHKCWNGPQRLAKVKLVCGRKNEILQVSEPEKCEYHIDLSTPLGCNELTEDQIRNNFKVNYELL